MSGSVVFFLSSSSRSSATRDQSRSQTRFVEGNGKRHATLTIIDAPEPRMSERLARISCMHKEPTVEETIKSALDEIDEIQIPVRQQGSQ